VIGFPEGFIPAHPLWYHFHPASGSRSIGFARELFKNAVEIPSPSTDALCDAARRANATVVLGVCERVPGTMGTLYNTQLFIGSRGEILGKHRKLTPTLGERLVHAGGHGDTLKVFETEFGPIGGLICGENSNPLASFALQAMGERIHVASWPAHFNHSTPMHEVIDFAGRSFAYKTGVFVINAVGAISDEMRQVLAANEDDRAFLERTMAAPGSSIIGPTGRVLAGPLEGGEGIVYADIDLEQIIVAKSIHDYAGHYNRMDVFSLTLNTQAPPTLRLRSEHASRGELGLEEAAPSLEEFVPDLPVGPRARLLGSGE
jgi:aliphatic nitrilase